MQLATEAEAGRRAAPLDFHLALLPFGLPSIRRGAAAVRRWLRAVLEDPQPGLHPPRHRCELGRQCWQPASLLTVDSWHCGEEKGRVPFCSAACWAPGPSVSCSPAWCQHQVASTLHTARVHATAPHLAVCMPLAAGKPVAFKLMPQHTPLLLAAPDSSIAQRGAFATKVHRGRACRQGRPCREDCRSCCYEPVTSLLFKLRSIRQPSARTACNFAGAA